MEINGFLPGDGVVIQGYDYCCEYEYRSTSSEKKLDWE